MKVMTIRDGELMSYLSGEEQRYRLSETPTKVALKHMLSIYDDYDFKSDSERPELLVHTNEDLIADDEDLAILRKNFEGKKTPDKMLKALLKVEVAVYTYDAYSIQGKVSPNPVR